MPFYGATDKPVLTSSAVSSGLYDIRNIEISFHDIS